MSNDVLNRIRQWLADAGVAFDEVDHAPTRTSEQSAQARGEDLSIGGKALLLKVDETFSLFVLSAARKLDSGAIKRQFKARRVRFANAEELHRLTGLEPGAVPPFGKPILPLDLFVDQSILDNQRVAFNAGSLTHSLVMSVDDYVRVARPQGLSFSRAHAGESP